MTWGYSHKAVRLLSFKSSARIWAQLHGTAFRRLSGSPRLMIRDNPEIDSARPSWNQIREGRIEGS